MSWINSRQFTISTRNGRHYVFRRNNAGNTEINIPANIVSKGQAIAWLKAHPDKVANPTRYRAKGKRAATPPKQRLIPYKTIKVDCSIEDSYQELRFLNTSHRHPPSPLQVVGGIRRPSSSLSKGHHKDR